MSSDAITRSAILLQVENLGKSYRIWTDPAQRLISPVLQEMAKLLPPLIGDRFRKRASAGYRDFNALQGVSFELARGEAIGIIGRNGAGKSTLLQIIAGTLQPSTGRAVTHGRVAALLELGSGFNPEFTGQENVHLTCSVLGMSRRESEERYASIVQFADIGDFITQPVKTYSSGMMVRLAFAVQTAVEPDILIVDEALSVGDFFFQQKCFARIAELRTRGTALLFVSHDMSSVRDLCDQVLYLRSGRTAFLGDSQQAISHYYNEATKASAPSPNIKHPDRTVPLLPRKQEALRSQAQWWVGSPPPPSKGPAHLMGVAILDETGQQVTQARIGEKLLFQVLFMATKAGEYQVAVELKNRFDQVVNSSSSYTCGLSPCPLQPGESALFELAITMDFEAGLYTWQAILAESSALPNRAERIDTSPWLGPLKITWDYELHPAPFLGMFGPPVRARFIPAAE